MVDGWGERPLSNLFFWGREGLRVGCDLFHDKVIR